MLSFVQGEEVLGRSMKKWEVEDWEKKSEIKKVKK